MLERSTERLRLLSGSNGGTEPHPAGAWHAMPLQESPARGEDVSPAFLDGARRIVPLQGTLQQGREKSYATIFATGTGLCS